jgi:hypothetical protein
MNVQHSRSLLADAGNTLLEFGIVAAVVLLITLPGLYLVGNNFREWTDGLKANMTHHRDQAAAVSKQTQEFERKHNEDFESSTSSDKHSQDSDSHDGSSHGPFVSGVNGETDTIPKSPRHRRPGTHYDTTANLPSNGQTATQAGSSETSTPEEPDDKKKHLRWCSQVESGSCLEATGTPGIARKVFKVNPTGEATSSQGGTTPLPWCSQGLPGPCNMSKKAREKAAEASAGTTGSTPSTP